MIRRLIASAGCAALALAANGGVLAPQAATGLIEGIARSTDDSSAIVFALIRLQRAESRGVESLVQQITTATGRFRFAGLPAGQYRLQLLRIGYRPVASAPITIAGGDTVRHELHAPTVAVQLEPVTVRAEGSCFTISQLLGEPRLATLWQEAQKGAEIRRGLELQYRFKRTVTQEGTVKWRLKSRRLRRTDTVVNEPDSVLAREERRRAAGRTSGYNKGGLLVVPDEKELLHDDFLRSHCLEVSLTWAEGEVGLRFRPIQPRRDATEIRGTIWVDASTYMMRRLEVEWLRGAAVVGQSHIEYADVPVAGGALRLPVTGRAWARPSGVTRTLISRADVQLRYDYRDFEQVRGP